MHTRLNLYKRLASAEKSEQIDALLEEITDRFGKPWMINCLKEC